MKVSVITICHNSAATLEDTIRSVALQDYPDIEYIIVDGASEDNSKKIVSRYKEIVSRFVSEKDEGIYDALNKGISISGGDVIALLHSDDLYADDNIISRVVDAFNKTDADAIYTDLEYVDRVDVHKTVRLWKAGAYHESLFLKGWMPPHPALFVKKNVYDRFGLYNKSFSISADYEFMLRVIHKHGIKVSYLPGVGIRMRVGGKSNISVKNRLLANREDRLAWKVNGIRPHWYTTLLKPLSKLRQFRKL